MPLLVPDHIAKFQQELTNTTVVIFSEVLLPQQYFATANGATIDIMFKRLNDATGYILLIDEEVRYLGTEADIIEAFLNTPRNGWRPLTIFRVATPETVLRHADAFLGLDNQKPRILKAEPPKPREIVIKAEEIHQQEGVEKTNEERFGRDLVEEVRHGRLEPPLFRDQETEALIRILSKAGKNAACLVGEPGVGKTAVVEGLALAIAEGRVPGVLAKARLLDINLSFLAAGATFKNEFEGRMKELLDLARQDQNVILFLDELHTIRGQSSDASQMIKSDLGRGRIRCVGATTNSEFRLIEADTALARRFQVVPVAELTPTQSTEVLRAYAARFSQHHQIIIPDELYPIIIDFAVKYVPDRYLPDKAIDLLDEACACAQLQALKSSTHKSPQPLR